MKKILMLFVATLSFTSTPLSFARHNDTSSSHNTKKRQQVVAAYVSSLVLSGGIGAVTGGVLRHLEKKLNIEAYPLGLFLAFLGWALESELRNDIIVALQKDLDEYGVAYKQGLMFKGAWIASWISYLHA